MEHLTLKEKIDNFWVKIFPRYKDIMNDDVRKVKDDILNDFKNEFQSDFDNIEIQRIDGEWVDISIGDLILIIEWDGEISFDE